jgi:hypothetical protein
MTLGDLNRNTIVEVEVGGRSMGLRRAGEVEALRPHFDEVTPLELTTPETPTSAAEIITTSHLNESNEAPASGGATIGSDKTTPAEPSPDAQFSPSPIAGSATKSNANGGNTPTTSQAPAAAPIIIGMIIVAIVIFTIKSCADHRKGGSSAGDTQTVYVTRQVNLRPSPSSENTPSGSLDRGVSISGVWNDPSKTWFQITSGDHQGAYVWGMDLANRPRPDLAARIGASQSTIGPSTERHEPDDTAPLERELAAGQNVYVIGRLASGWWEIANKGAAAATIGGVGYLPPAAFEAPAAVSP